MNPLTELCFANIACFTRSEWVSLDGGIIGAFAAVLAAYLIERWRERRKSMIARRRLKIALRELQLLLEPFEGTEGSAWVDADAHPDVVAVWRKIVTVDAMVQWAMNDPNLFDFEGWGEVGHLGALLDNRDGQVASARVSIPAFGTTNNATGTPLFADIMLPQMRRVIDVL